ncbi:MAG: hypothetical protein ACNI3C_00450 [Candidatus Marinarcus sp.]|uniref:hypothetical protein n=1 Tax=Candidatus Marinarcus sp. TaxID=3100987 RepID=UPI003AFF9044
MKKLLAFSIIGISLMASELVVKKSDVKISVNGEIKSLSKDASLNLEDGSSVCFLEGEGKVIINKHKQLTKKSKKCYSTPLPEGFKIEDFVEGLTNSAKVALITGELKVKNGVSTKSIQTSQTVTGNYEITSEQKEIIVYNELYGPLPVTLKIIDKDKNIVQEFINEENTVTLFRIPTNILKENYNILITNAFDEELLNQTIINKKQVK